MAEDAHGDAVYAAHGLVRSMEGSSYVLFYSGWIPAALIMGHHLLISALCRAASAFGVC